MRDTPISAATGDGGGQTLLRQRTPPRPSIAPRTRLRNGKFELGERLDGAGMGAVYEALDPGNMPIRLRMTDKF